MILEVVGSILIILFIWFLKTCYNRRGMPPGPFPLPIIGNLHLILDDDLPFSAEKFREKYGNTFTLVFPTENVVMVTDTATAREALLTKKDIFQGRLSDVVYPMNEVLQTKDLVTSGLDHKYRLRRKAFVMAMHTFGEGKKIVHENINDQLDEFSKAVESLNGQPFDPSHIFESSIASILWRWITGKTNNIEDGTVGKLRAFNKAFFSCLYSGPLYRLIPALKHFPTKHIKGVENLKDKLRTIFITAVEEKEKAFSLRSRKNPNDFDEEEYQNIMESLIAWCTHLEIEDCVPFLSADVILGGSDTISTFFVWFLLYIILDQELQKKLQNEIDEVLQGDEVLQWKDMSKLPYLQATVCEVMRHSYFVPLSLPHNPVIETQLQGYRIPKGTTIFLDYHCIHRDENVWKNPSVFNPDRFIDENGKFVGWRVKPGFMAFGIGSRSCPGENLSRAQIMFFTSGMLKRYTFEVNEDEPMPTLERGEAAGKFPPKPFKAIARKRE
ncbi:cytochrome P450 2J2-like isoform X3 [Dendronephthya gigantea]|uniref:cytochrome P450 2J2-like isoform X3 n=1 Tax=Dendronephthya gigantea TaxID=151771 RepID=UPI00106AEC27|nr:cytochrome P450 2J2-like isoform X3 [Dendronephthya gigantea]